MCADGCVGVRVRPCASVSRSHLVLFQPFAEVLEVGNVVGDDVDLLPDVPFDLLVRVVALQVGRDRVEERQGLLARLAQLLLLACQGRQSITAKSPGKEEGAGRAKHTGGQRPTKAIAATRGWLWWWWWCHWTEEGVELGPAVDDLRGQRSRLLQLLQLGA